MVVEEEHREHPGNGSHPVGILFQRDKAQGAAAVQHIPLAVLDVRNLLFRIVDLLLAFGEFLLRIGLLGLVFGAGSVQLFLTGLVLCPALIQLGAGGLKLGVGGGSTGAQLELALQQLHLHAAQGGFGFGDKVGVGEVG